MRHFHPIASLVCIAVAVASPASPVSAQDLKLCNLRRVSIRSLLSRLAYALAIGNLQICFEALREYFALSTHKHKGPTILNCALYVALLGKHSEAARLAGSARAAYRENDFTPVLAHADVNSASCFCAVL